MSTQGEKGMEERSEAYQKQKRRKKVNNFSNLILPKLKPSLKFALTSTYYIHVS